jgi:hypothetical protein
MLVCVEDVSLGHECRSSFILVIAPHCLKCLECTPSYGCMRDRVMRMMSFSKNPIGVSCVKLKFICACKVVRYLMLATLSRW